MSRNVNSNRLKKGKVFSTLTLLGLSSHSIGLISVARVQQAGTLQSMNAQK